MKIGLMGALFLVFTTLKLMGTITWSWWWVTSPLWLPLGIFGGIFLSVALVTGLIVSLSGGKK